MPDLLRLLLPSESADPFEAADCDDSGAREHLVEHNDDAADVVGASGREVA